MRVMSETVPVPRSHSPPHSSLFLRGRPSPCSTKVTLIVQDMHPQAPSGHPPAHVLSGPPDTRPAHSPHPGRFTVPSEEPSSRTLFPTPPTPHSSSLTSSFLPLGCKTMHWCCTHNTVPRPHAVVLADPTFWTVHSESHVLASTFHAHTRGALGGPFLSQGTGLEPSQHARPAWSYAGAVPTHTSAGPAQ